MIFEIRKIRTALVEINVIDITNLKFYNKFNS